MLGVKPGECCNGVTEDADLLKSGWKKRGFCGNERTFRER